MISQDKIHLVIKKLIETGDQKHYVLEQVDDKQIYLLPFEPYHKYHFQIGQTIIATIDKINCSGEIFLEPEHPYYQKGKCYWFDLIDLKENSQSIEITVKDVMENLITLSIDEKPNIENNRVYLCIKTIRKGLPVLCLKPEDAFSYQKGQWYIFHIEKIDRNAQEPFILLRDEHNNTFKLHLSYYENYPFKENEKIRCFVSDITPKGEIHLEPEHPLYPLNSKVTLKLASNEIIFLSERQQKHPSCVLINEKNEKFYLPIIFINTPIDPKAWKSYRVYRFRKGKILVKPVEVDEQMSEVGQP